MSKKYCQGFHPRTVLICGPDPLSDIPKPCVKFPKNIVSPTWNLQKYKNIRKKRIVQDNCQIKQYQPAVKTQIINPKHGVRSHIMTVTQSGCECGPATPTRLRLGNNPSGIDFRAVSIVGNNGQFQRHLPVDGRCIIISVDDQILLNKSLMDNKFNIALERVNGGQTTIRFPGFCFKLSAITYTLNFYENL